MATQSEVGQNSQATSTPKFGDRLLRYMGLSRRGTALYLTTRSTWQGSMTRSIDFRGNQRLLRVDTKARILDADVRYELDVPDMWGALLYLDISSVAALAHDRRTLVYQVTHDMQRLWELGSVEEFKKCYVDLLEAHFYAYDLGRVLHRDIDESSALARIGADGKAAGLLNDWDLSCHVDGEGLGKRLTPQLCSGTTPFMAIDLERIASDKSAMLDHRYCHDLESFFWFLVWAVLHFDLRHKRYLDCLDADWSGEWTLSSRFKRVFLKNGDTMDGVLDNALDIWEDVVSRWVRPLACLLDNARQRSMKWINKRRKVFSDDAYAKQLTFETFMQTIEQTPRAQAHEGA